MKTLDESIMDCHAMADHIAAQFREIERLLRALSRDTPMLDGLDVKRLKKSLLKQVYKSSLTLRTVQNLSE